MVAERWLPVVGYEDLYEVSDQGRIRRTAGSPHCPHGRTLRPLSMKIGYLQVGLCKDGKRSLRYIHRLVADAFLGACPSGHEVNHKDGNKRNSLLTNLEYVTSSENRHHAVLNGMLPEGEHCSWAKLTSADVRFIRANFQQGVDSPAKWAARYACAPSNIDAIVKGRSWKFRSTAPQKMAVA